MNIYDAPEPSEYVRTETDRSGHGRQIQPLACVSKTGSEKGVCMFAWNCVEAGGKHLGTCIDRFYFGSCCKLPENNLDNPNIEDNEIQDVVVNFSSSSSSTSTSSTSTTTLEASTTSTTTTTTTTPTSTTTTTTTTTTPSTTTTTT